MANIFIGLISGTSADSIDAVAVEFNTQNKQSKYIAAMAVDFDPSLREKIFALQSRAIQLSELGELDTQLGHAFADAALTLIETNQLNKTDIQAIGSHGQTLLHRPDSDIPFTMQVGDPNIIAERTNITTVADFRRRDIAAGGQGAPLVLAFHQAWLGQQKNTIVLNLGGIANITVLSPDELEPLLGFDTGPANTLLDAWSRKHLAENYDNEGLWARQGKVNEKLLSSLLKHPYFRQTPPKSADIGQFNEAWLNNFLDLFPDIATQDVAATLVTLTADSIGQAIQQWSPDTELVVACGGGCFNTYLMEQLAQKISPIRLCTSDAFGIQPAWVEATAFAWLAQQTLRQESGNAPKSTGAVGARILGGVYQA